MKLLAFQHNPLLSDRHLKLYFLLDLLCFNRMSPAQSNPVSPRRERSAISELSGRRSSRQGQYSQYFCNNTLLVIYKCFRFSSIPGLSYSKMIKRTYRPFLAAAADFFKKLELLNPHRVTSSAVTTTPISRHNVPHHNPVILSTRPSGS